MVVPLCSIAFFKIIGIASASLLIFMPLMVYDFFSGCIFASHKDSSTYILPRPAINDWLSNFDLIMLFDFDRPCIQGISFSMSKGFYGAEKLRIGLRLTREYKDDPVEVFNSMQMLNTIGVHVGLEIMNHYEFNGLNVKQNLSI